MYFKSIIGNSLFLIEVINSSLLITGAFSSSFNILLLKSYTLKLGRIAYLNKIALNLGVHPYTLIYLPCF